MDTKLYVKKLWSLNPNKYKYIRLDLAMEKYSRYVVSCIDAGYKEWKPFQKWLSTEI